MIATAPAADAITGLLDQYGARVRERLARHLHMREPRRYLYDIAADYPARGGRMLRPAMCLAATAAFGGSVDDAVGTATAIEMLHNAFLVHDDIEDESDRRRGLPSLPALHGVAAALNAGDALAVCSLEPLIANRSLLGPGVAFDLMEDAIHTATVSIEGQALELGWRRDNVLDLDTVDYLGMILKKTCWYTTIFPCLAGATIARRGRPARDPFIRFGYFLGAAFQIQDDVLNLIGREEAYGKERDGDLFEGKRTLMIVRLYRQSTPADRAVVAQILGRSRDARNSQDVAWLRERLVRSGAIRYAQELASSLAGAAVYELTQLLRGVPDSPDRRFLEALPRWVIERA